MDKKRMLILGLGNEILSDDGIGILVVRRLKEKFEGYSFLDIKESSEMGLSLLDFFVGYEIVVLIDSVQTGRVEVGYLHELEESDLKVIEGVSPHYTGVSEVLVIGKTLGLEMPRKVKIFAIEVKDPFTVSTNITPELLQKMPSIIDKIGWYINILINKTLSVN
ncbi:MAG: hydrogenase maturation protease [Planctomycetota bacterium]